MAKTEMRPVSCVPLLCFLVMSLTGCAGLPLSTARSLFYAGQLDKAEAVLAERPGPNTDAVLFLMERGTIRQAALKHEESTRDWLEAVDRQDYLETHSATEQAASLIVNDRTVSFRGMPFERTLLHTALAQNYLARGMWQDAGVEARNIIAHLQNLNGFPDDPYSRYMAGFCLELLRDNSNAALQYRNAGKLIEQVSIDENTGAIRPAAREGETNAAFAEAEGTYELVCFVSIGRSPSGYESSSSLWIPRSSPYAEFYCGNVYLGRSYPMINTPQLISETMAKTALADGAKDALRIGIKETIAHQIGEQNAPLGQLAEIFLYAMEQPDYRRWETLPLWFEVARFPCPADLPSFTVVFKGPAGVVYRNVIVTQPIRRSGNVFISFCRDLPEPPPALR